MRASHFAGLLLVAACPLASANIITVEPDDYAPGTNLSLAVDGVGLLTFTSVTGGGYSFSPVYAGTQPLCASNPLVCESVTGTTGFSPRADGYSGSRGWGEALSAATCFPDTLTGLCARSSLFYTMLISFDAPTDFVQISGTYFSDSPEMYIFDANRQRITDATYSGQFTNREGSNGGYTYNLGVVGYQSRTANIHYAIAGSWSTNSSLDVLKYNDGQTGVPEPGSLALFGAGLAVLLGARRRGHIDGDGNGAPGRS